MGKGKTEDKEKRTGAEMKDSREKEIVVIMGAGLSGRGYLARQLDLERYELVFLDKNRDLVERLVLEGSYEICFFCVF